MGRLWPPMMDSELHLGHGFPSRGSDLRVLLVGQARWARIIAAGLNEFTDIEADVIAIDAIRDALGLFSDRRFQRADLLVRVGFRPGAHTVRGMVFDAIFGMMRSLRETPLMYYWLGTDVQNHANEVGSGASQARFRRLAGSATHLADSVALRDELAALGVESTTAWLPAPNATQSGGVSPLPERFTVLSYVPDARYEFYDGPTLVKVAERMPEALFRIVGGSGSWLDDVPENVEFLGWRDDLDRLYAESTVLVRSLEHDSVSCMVVEALAHGRPVICSSVFPHAVRVKYGDPDSLEAVLRRTGEAAAAGGATVSSDVVSWARETADPSSCYGSIAEALHKAAGR